jgi:hypothetical protein
LPDITTEKRVSVGAALAVTPASKKADKSAAAVVGRMGTPVFGRYGRTNDARHATFRRSSLLVESGQGPFDNAVKRRDFCRL